MKALLIVDIQNDFCPGGALQVTGGNEIVPIVNRLKQRFPLAVFTQDWHPPDHKSFASQHRGKKPGQIITLNGADQILWPDHCVQNTPGACFHQKLLVQKNDPIFRKGMDPEIDSYSAFYDNLHKKDTGLTAFLKSKGVDELYLCGLATDYCVKFSALDALEEGFRVYVIEDACRGVNLKADDSSGALDEIRNRSGKAVKSTNLKHLYSARS